MNIYKNEQKLELLWNVYIANIQSETPDSKLLDSLESMIRHLNDKEVEMEKVKAITDRILPLAEKAITLFNQKQS